FPSVIFFGHGIETKIRRERYASRAISPAILEAVRAGDTDEEVIKRAGEPIEDSTWNRRRGPRAGKKARRERSDEDHRPVRRYMMYFDGNRRWSLDFEAGILHSKRGDPLINFE